MKRPTGSPEWLEVFTAEERPDIWELARDTDLFHGLWPEYNHHGNHTGTYFGSLYPELAHLQLVFVDRRTDELVARGRTIAFQWDGTLEDLPEGIDALGIRAVEGTRPGNALSALAAEVVPGYQGDGLSRLAIEAMKIAAARNGLSPLVAPVRPNRKDRYPLIPIERYAAWQRADGLPFDPWLRVHIRAGGRVIRSAPRSLEITAPIERWKSWTEMEFPDDGEYVFPGGLAPLSVRDGVGEYWEPNVWVLHEVEGGPSGQRVSNSTGSR